MRPVREAFRERAAAYLRAVETTAERQGHYTPGTAARIRRNLAVIERDLAHVVANVPHPRDTGPAHGIAPGHIRKEHVAALLALWEHRPVANGRNKGQVGLSMATRAKMVQDLRGFLDWCGNTVFDHIEKEEKSIRLPSVVRDEDEEFETPSDSDLDRLRAAAEGMEGYRGAVARLLLGVLPYCGLRPKEIRGAHVADVDLKRGEILVRHPKGEGSWAKGGKYAPLRWEPAKQAVRDFLVEREGEFPNGIGDPWLIPYRLAARGHSGEWDATVTGPWPEATLRKLKQDLVERSGVEFGGWKVLRTTFAMDLSDRGVPPEVAQKALRHKTVVTTQRYYWKKRKAAAYAVLDDAYARPKVVPRGPDGV